MLITLTCHCPNAPEIGYLLGKNPSSIFQREFSAGTVWVFYPDVAEDHVSVALLTEIDPVGLVRGPAAGRSLEQYVNDRPFVSTSLTSVALRTAFSSALAERSPQPDRADEHMRWEIALPAVACDGGEALIARIFTPVGYSVSLKRLPLDSHFPSWGDSNVFSVRLEGSQTVRDVLGHLYVLLPVLDNNKHYYVEHSEIEKLLRHGRTWLANHPERELIARRYLRYKRPLVTSLLTQLAALEDAAIDGDADTASSPQESTELVSPAEPVPGLHEQRLQAALESVREVEAASLLDLGCGEGKLLELALKERQLTRILGLDVSSQALARARARLHWETMPQAKRKRIDIILGSLLYRDSRLSGFDVATLTEVIEHLDTARLEAMERVVFEHARPRRVIITTPNHEYNVHWEQLGGDKMRHKDHRFEWTRAECEMWAERVAAAHGYRFTQRGIGPDETGIGSPTQMVVFDILE
jgi:3' terminal RNA ribose 2'-O-methyltransferase Hen1